MTVRKQQTNSQHNEPGLYSGLRLNDGFTSSGLAIEAAGLTKTFGKTLAVDGVDLKVPEGIVFGFLGPNGAGKTTTIRILATLLQPDAGSASLFGHDLVGEPDAVRKRISLTGQFASVDDELTGLENLILIARLQGYKRRQAKIRTNELLHAFGLEEASSRPVKTYSGGMRRRIDIAASIVVSPDLLCTSWIDTRHGNRR